MVTEEEQQTGSGSYEQRHLLCCHPGPGNGTRSHPHDSGYAKNSIMDRSGQWSKFQNLLGEPYNLRETIGWLWRNIRGVRKTNPCGIPQLPQRSILNTIHPRIKLGFVGDIMGMHQKSLLVSADVMEFLRPCDFVVGNFEATMTTARKPRLTAQAQNVSILDSLARCFPPERTFLSLANNHAGDFSADVFRASLNILEQRGFHTFGLVQCPFVHITDRIRVVAASMWSNRPFLEMVPFESLERYCGEDVFNIAFPHWGYELEWFPRLAIVQTGQQLLQRYDAIIGHHSHVPQPLTASESGDTWKLTAFSLGDFCTGLKMKKYQFGMICRMDIGPGEDGLLKAGAVEWRYTKISPASPGTMEVSVVSGVLI
jgi:hypothetical protein